MSGLKALFSSRRRLWELQREVEKLRKENHQLRSQNDSMRAGMRRCVTCDYRLDYKARQGNAPVLNPAGTPGNS